MRRAVEYSTPVILGHHLILAAYGFWLPNDPRGSWSTFVGSKSLLKFGPATKVDTHRSVAARPHDREARHAAKRALKYPAIRFSGLQARAIGRGFAEYAGKSSLKVWTCRIMPDHAHLVVGEHRCDIGQIATQLKGAATRRLIAENLHPLVAWATAGKRPPTPWARGEWKVFLKTEEDVFRRIKYVEENPVRAGLRQQKWSFVTTFKRKGGSIFRR